MDMSTCSQCGTVTPSSAMGRLDVTVPPESRHHRLLNSNEPPEDPELGFIRSVVADADARLMRLDEDLAQLRDRVRQLEEERAALSSFHTRNNAILSPLRKLPPEVLGEIFSWTLPFKTTKMFRATDSPWVLTHISHRWRAVAVLDSSLWSLLRIHYSSATNPKLSYPLCMVKTQVARAKTLKIHFYGSEALDPLPQIEVFDYLAVHASRWEELALGLTSPLVPLLASLRDRVPLLQRLWIEWCGETQAAAYSINCFQTTPSLMDASVNNTHGVISVALPFHNLTRYHLETSWAAHQGILKLAHSLVEASISCHSHGDAPWPNPDEIIELRVLRRLFASHPQILGYLRTPCLEEFAVDFLEHENTILQTHLESLVLRSACPLRRLCLSGIPAVLPVAEILSRIPSIVHFTASISVPRAAIGVNGLISHLTVPTLAMWS
ncbi:hypothetical protein B0H13DRAFT_2507134 [Mycena leptocephala]|nr:hypothetical protein B0H13DRAFT_2507134 [Mycena leptocephala]